MRAILCLVGKIANIFSFEHMQRSIRHVLRSGRCITITIAIDMLLLLRAWHTTKH